MKTSELIGPALEWAVATCEGWGDWDGDAEGFFSRHKEHDVLWLHECNYSTDWSQGGPLIEREKLSVEIKPHGYWMGSFQYNYAEEKEFLSLGPTPLIAAMLAFVASRFGDEVDIPEGLL